MFKVCAGLCRSQREERGFKTENKVQLEFVNAIHSLCFKFEPIKSSRLYLLLHLPFFPFEVSV